jgi:hypothetical protein
MSAVMKAAFLVVLVALLVAGYLVFGRYADQEVVQPEGVEEIEGSADVGDVKGCEVSADCVHYGKTGECNCGCFNKDYSDWEAGGECFCAAPTSCECVDGVCEGVY